MSRLMLMSDLVLRCQRRANMEGDPFIGAPEWKALISEMYGRIYSNVTKAGMRHVESTQTITANGATQYSLPADHDCTIGIDRTEASSGRKFELGELMVQERNAWSGQTGDAVAYSIVGQNIVLFPRPLSGTYTHVYVPQAPDLSALADTSTVDVITADGEEFLIEGVAAKARPKRQEDPRPHMQARDEAEVRFVEDLMLRALVNPRRKVITRSPVDSYCDDFGLSDDPASWSWRFR